MGVSAGGAGAAQPGAPLVRVAIAGAGAMGRAHADAFRDVPGVRLAGVCSRTRSSAEGLAGRVGAACVADTIDGLYAGCSADVVVVAVPELVALQTGLACLAHPWIVLMEKPPGHTPAEAKRLLAVATERGRRVFVGLNRRAYGSTRAAVADLGADSSPRFIHVQDQQDLEEARTLGQPPEVVRHWMYANSIHVVDYLRVFGRGAVTAVTPVERWRGGGAGVVLATVRFASGDLGVYEGIWGGPGPWAVSVATPRCRWELRPLETATRQARGSRAREPVPEHPWDSAFKPGLRYQAEQVVRAARDEASTAATLPSAVETMDLIAAIFATA